MEKIKRFIDCYIPIEGCTLRCHYCYVTQRRTFNNVLPEFKYSPDFIRMALSKKRLGGTCLINFCAGGETLLSPIIVQYAKALLEEGHYVMIVTNATISKRFDEFAAFPPELTKHLFFKFSYHYLQLKEKNLLDQFFNHIDKVRNAGCSFTLEATPSDELVPYIDEMMQVSIRNVGAPCHITVARDESAMGDLPILTKMSREEYKKTWSVFNSSLFDFKLSIFGKKRTEFCYAGQWTASMNLGTGVLRQCYCSFFDQNIYEDITKPINFIPIGKHCSQYHCYNGHVWLGLGNIPGLDCPSYAEMRNRKCADGSEWLQPEMKAFLESRLYEQNRVYSKIGEWIANQRIQMIIEGGYANWIKIRVKRFLHF